MLDVFPILPASAKPLWWLASICGLLLLICAVLGYTAYASRHSRIEVGGGELRIVGDFWGRSIPIAALRLDQAAVVDLDEAPELAPKRRTLGTGLPGYASGWFRLHSGEKALVYLTTRNSVVHIPTAQGYSLLLSAERPRELLETLEAQAGA